MKKLSILALFILTTSVSYGRDFYNGKFNLKLTQTQPFSSNTKLVETIAQISVSTEKKPKNYWEYNTTDLYWAYENTDFYCEIKILNKIYSCKFIKNNEENVNFIAFESKTIIKLVQDLTNRRENDFVPLDRWWDHNMLGYFEFNNQEILGGHGGTIAIDTKSEIGSYHLSFSSLQ